MPWFPPPPCRALLLLTAVLLAATPARAVTFGAVGDSLTDEYQFENGLPAFNFVEQLVFLRGLDFGARVTDKAIRGEPRNEGFSHNWARFGASANEPTYANVNLFDELPRLNPMPLFEVQISGLAMEIADGDIDVVYVGIGANDVFIHLFQGGNFQGPAFEAFADALVEKIFFAVDTFLAAGPVTILVGAVPDDLVPNPGARPPISPFIDPADLAAAVAEINQAILQQAIARGGVHFVDLFDVVDARTSAGNVTIGGESFSVQSSARLRDLIINPGPGVEHGPCNLSETLCANETYASNFYTHDQVHPNTIVQSFMANAFIAALNDTLGLGIAPLSDQEILDVALRPLPEPGALAWVALAVALTAVARARPGGAAG